MSTFLQDKPSESFLKRLYNHKNRNTTWLWFLLYVVTFLVVLPILFGDCNHSVYFTLRRYCSDRTPFIKQLLQQDENRLHSAQKFFASADQTQVVAALDQLAEKRPTVDIVIAMVTVARKPLVNGSHTPEYITKSIWKLISQLTDPKIMSDFPYSVKMIICNGGWKPVLNKPALRLGKYVRLLNISGKTEPQTVADVKENEKIDYMVCLNESLKYMPRYVLALEDDAFATDDMFTLLKYVISEKLERRISQGRTITGSQEEVYVKLNHPECKLWYYKPGLHNKLELLGLSFLLGTSLALIHEAVMKYMDQSTSREQDMLNLIAWCVYIALVILAIGRPCVLEFRRFLTPHLYAYGPASKCCTPAFLYPNHGARAVVEYLNQTRITQPYGKDTLIDFMLTAKNMKAYQLLPNIFVHIGQKSSGLNRDPYCVY